MGGYRRYILSLKPESLWCLAHHSVYVPDKPALKPEYLENLKLKLAVSTERPYGLAGDFNAQLYYFCEAAMNLKSF